MKLSTSQKTAKQWEKHTVHINNSEIGQVAVAWADEQGNKHIGYIDIFDLEIVNNKGKNQSFGSFVEGLVKADDQLFSTVSDLLIANTRLETQITEQTSKIDELKAMVRKYELRLTELWNDIYPDRPFGL